MCLGSNPAETALWSRESFYDRWIVQLPWATTALNPKGKVLVAQLCPTLCDPVDCSPLGSSVLGMLQARVPEWVAIPFSRGSSQPKDQTWVSRIVGRFFYHLSHQGNTNNVEFSIKYRDEDSLSYLTSNWKPRRDFSKMLTIKELSFFFFFLLEQCIERQIQQPGNWNLKKV